MNYRKELGTVGAVALVVVAIGLAVAAIAPNAAGWHRISLSSTTHSIDTGTGFFTVAGQSATDSVVRDGFFLANGSYLAGSDRLASRYSPFSGSARTLTGRVTSGVGAYTIQMTETASIAVSLTYTDSSTGSGTWSSELTGNSGTATDQGILDTSTKRITVGDTTTAGDTFPFSSLFIGDSVNLAVATDTVVFAELDTAVGGDTMRLIVIGPSGLVIKDTQMAQASDAPLVGLTNTGDTLFFTQGTVRFDQGTTKLIFVFWDTVAQKYTFKVARVTVAADRDTIAGGSGVASSPVMTNVQVTVTITPSNPTVALVEFADLQNDLAPRADSFAIVDTNTSNFDTRLIGTVFEINLYDASGQRIYEFISGGQIVTVQYLNFAAAGSPSYTLLRRDEATNSWTTDGISVLTAADTTITARVTKFSTYALGRLSGSSTGVGGDGGNCVVRDSVNNTWLSSVMPTLRGVRDVVLDNPVGRLIVSAYYMLG